MKDYAAMSDFEINCLVAGEAGLADVMFFDVDSDICNGPVWDLPSGGYDDFIAKKGCPFDPCNNPADAWPILLANEISLVKWQHDDVWAAWSGAGMAYGEVECDYSEHDENPLRAGMIVFLMMKESENDSQS